MATQKPQKKTKEYKKGKVTAKSALNFRKTPESGDNLLPQGPIKRGTIIEILSEKKVDEKLWYRVRFDGKIGYVMADFIDII